MNFFRVSDPGSRIFFLLIQYFASETISKKKVSLHPFFQVGSGIRDEKSSDPDPG
jgi:hypothetical protein